MVQICTGSTRLSCYGNTNQQAGLVIVAKQRPRVKPGSNLSATEPLRFGLKKNQSIRVQRHHWCFVILKCHTYLWNSAFTYLFRVDLSAWKQAHTLFHNYYRKTLTYLIAFSTHFLHFFTTKTRNTKPHFLFANATVRWSTRFKWNGCFWYTVRHLSPNSWSHFANLTYLTDCTDVWRHPFPPAPAATALCERKPRESAIITTIRSIRSQFLPCVFPSAHDPRERNTGRRTIIL